MTTLLTYLCPICESENVDARVLGKFLRCNACGFFGAGYKIKKNDEK